MRLSDLTEDMNFLAGTQTKSYLDLILKCLMNSSRAITNYLSMPQERHHEMMQHVITSLKAKDQDSYGDMYDIVDALKADGHIRSLNDVRKIGQFFQVVDSVIKAKRPQE